MNPMGIYDRDYYREPSESWWLSSRSLKVTVGIMVLIGGVFFAQVLSSNPARNRPDALLLNGVFDWAAIVGGEVWRLVSFHFLHVRNGLLQVALEMWALYFFGKKIENLLGSLEYALFLVMSLVGISAIKMLAATAGLEREALSFGTGPLVLAVLSAYVVYYTKLEHFFIISMPGYVAVGIVTAMLLLGDLGGEFALSGIVGYAAGAVVGFAYIYSGVQWSKFVGGRLLVRNPKARQRKLRLYDDPIEPTDPETPERKAVPVEQTATRRTAKEPRPAAVDEHLEAKVDQVLEKMSREGKDKLSAEEQKILQQASEVYKRRQSER
jgi:membrane associated rhomboid family serine protease